MGDTYRLRLNKYIYNSIKKRFPNLDILDETVNINFTQIKKTELFVESKKITGIPVSTGYRGRSVIEGRIYSIEKLSPSYIFQDSFKEKIIYIKEPIKPEKLRYILPLKPKAVILNTEFKRPLFIENFPVIYVPSILKETDIRIEITVKNVENSTKNIYFDIGYGAYFLFLVFPYDSRFQTKDCLDFYGSFQVTKEIIRRLLEVKKPSGYRIRVLFSDYKYADYRPLKEHIKKIDNDLILSIINTENCGLGNEKLIVKSEKNIIDRFHFDRINRLMKNLNLSIKTDRYEGLYFPDFKIPVVWFASQPNNNIYTLKKEFLNRNLIERFASNLFYIMNNLYKEIG